MAPEVSSFTVQVEELRRVAGATVPAIRAELVLVMRELMEMDNIAGPLALDAGKNLGRSFGDVTDVLYTHMVLAHISVGAIGEALTDVADVYALADGQR